MDALTFSSALQTPRLAIATGGFFSATYWIFLRSEPPHAQGDTAKDTFKWLAPITLSIVTAIVQQIYIGVLHLSNESYCR
jgi:hypothetical protein